MHYVKFLTSAIDILFAHIFCLQYEPASLIKISYCPKHTKSLRQSHFIMGLQNKCFKFIRHVTVFIVYGLWCKV